MYVQSTQPGQMRQVSAMQPGTVMQPVAQMSAGQLGKMIGQNGQSGSASRNQQQMPPQTVQQMSPQMVQRMAPQMVQQLSPQMPQQMPHQMPQHMMMAPQLPAAQMPQMPHIAHVVMGQPLTSQAMGGQPTRVRSQGPQAGSAP